MVDCKSGAVVTFIIVSAVALLATSYAPQRQASAQYPHSKHSPVIDDSLLCALTSHDKETRRSAYREFVAFHDALPAHLIAIAKRPKPATLTLYHPRYLAIRILPAVPSRDAIDFLIGRADQLDEGPAPIPSFSDGPFGPERHYPAILALLQLGHSSVGPILRRLSDEPETAFSDNAIEMFVRGVFFSVDGDRPEERYLRLVERAVADRPPDKTKNLRRLLQKMQDLSRG